MVRTWITAALCLVPAGFAAQEPAPRAFCDPVDPANRCPGMFCACVEDVLALRFEPGGVPAIDLDSLEAGVRFEASVVLEAKSGVQGWSHGVRHDGRAFTIESATTDGTDIGDLPLLFAFTRFEGVVECAPDPGAFPCPDEQPAAGFVSAVVLQGPETRLPPRTHSLARATYRVESFALEGGAAHFLLEFTEVLANRQSPPVRIGITVDGRSKRPKTLVDGRIVAFDKPFHRGDPDGDGRVSIADAIALLLFLFLSGPSPGCLDAGDADDDGRIDTTDAVVILRWLFGNGSPPAPPGPPPAACGPAPEGPGGSLGCDAYGGCFP